MKLLLRLPYPPSELSPNGRCDRWKKARITKKYRSDCAWIAKASQVTFSAEMDKPIRRNGFPWEKATATVTFHVPDPGRRRDEDNAFSSIKAAWDGIVDAGILTDDRGLRVIPAEPLFVKGDSAVWVELQRSQDSADNEQLDGESEA